jgi:hypothetical protein
MQSVKDELRSKICYTREILVIAAYLVSASTSRTLERLDQLQAALESLETHNVTISQLVLSLLRDPRLHNQVAVDNLVSHTTEILTALEVHPHTSKETLKWASNLMKARYASSIRELTRKEHGWHFSALRASAKQLEDFRIEDMAEKMRNLAPELWDMLGEVLSADRKQSRTRAGLSDEQDLDGDQIMLNVGETDAQAGEEHEESAGADDVNIADASNPNFTRKTHTVTERREALGIIVRNKILAGAEKENHYLYCRKELL